jgi:hypothetical protein
VQLGAGDDGLRAIGTGVSDVPITIGAGGGDAVGVLSTEDADHAGTAPVAISGNDGNDDLSTPVPGAATIDAGTGDDRVQGGGRGVGPETISLGVGNDRLVSSLDFFLRPISEIVDGGSGQDALETRGTFATESVEPPADAGHLLVTHELRDHIDAVGVEDVTWFGSGGNDETGPGDSVAGNDLSGTGIVHFTPDFTDPSDNTGPNNNFDQLGVVGTAGVDHLTVSGSGANITVAGLTPLVTRQPRHARHPADRHP